MTVHSISDARSRRLQATFTNTAETDSPKVAPVEHQFFTRKERAALESLIDPYFKAGFITNFTFQRGDDNSAFFAKCGKGDDVVFCVCKLGGKGANKYGVNMGTPDAFETLNFSDVLSRVRPALESLSAFERAEKRRAVAVSGAPKLVRS